MADERTINIGLKLTTDESTLFKDWHKIINGKGVGESRSNAQIIDEAIGTLRSDKQDKITSDNKLSADLIEGIKEYTSGTGIIISNQTIAVDLTTIAEKSDLSDFITASVNNLENYYLKTETYTRTEINNKIDAIKGIDFKIVSSVAEVVESGHIYLIKRQDEAEDNIYDEYIFVDNKAELIGTTRIDLSNYYTKDESYSKSEVDTKLDEVKDTLVNDVTVNGTSVVADNVASITLPTKVSAFENDANYISKSDPDYLKYKEAVDYLLAKANSGSVYDESGEDVRAYTSDGTLQTIFYNINK